MIGGRVAIALVAVAVVVVSGIGWATLHQLNTGVGRGPALPTGLPPAAAGKTSGAPASKAPDIDGKDENILLLGNDSIQGATPQELAALDTTADRDSEATDTMMILHVPADGSKATIISFPRDSWVDVPGEGMAKLNSAYADAYTAAQNGGANAASAAAEGIALTAQTLGELTGLHIDHYVQVNLLGFYEISEAVGGVNLCLNAAQNAQTENDDPNDPHPNGYSGINLKAGWNDNVEGSQALAFVRQRHGLPRGDLDRITRQQYFLSAVFHKVTSGSSLLNLSQINRTMKAVSKSLLVDRPLNVLSFVEEMEQLSAGKVEFATIPVVNPNGTEDGQSVVEVDPNAVRAYVDHLVGYAADPKLAQAKAVPAGQVTVSVVNAAGQNGVATKNAQALTALGFHASVGDDAPNPSSATEIDYPDGMQAQAKALAHYLPKATLVLDSNVHVLTLTLGADGIETSTLLPKVAPKTSVSSAPAPPGDVTTAAEWNRCIN